MELLETYRIRANFEGNHCGAAMYRLCPSSENAPVATMSVLWNTDKITFRLSFDRADSISVTCGNIVKTTVPTEATHETFFSWKELGLAIADLGQTVPYHAEIRCGADLSDSVGLLLLCNDTLLYSNPCNQPDSFSSDYCSIAGEPNHDMSRVDIGSCITRHGFCLFDRYSDGENYPASNHLLIAENIVGMNAKSGKLRFSCDLNIQKMPVYDFSECVPVGVYCCGIYFVLSPDSSLSTSFFGIYRSPSGLSFFENNGWVHRNSVPIGKQLGEPFRLEVVIENERTITAYIDGKRLVTFGYRPFVRASFGENRLTIRMQRRLLAKNHEDDFEVCLSNLHILQDHTESVLENISGEDLFGIPKDGETFTFRSSLCLKKNIRNNLCGFESPIQWKSSAPHILTDSGELRKRPLHAGEYGFLSMLLTDGKQAVTEKTFPFFVPAEEPSGKVLCIQNDLDPYTGSAAFADCAFRWNQNENSVVYDFGKAVNITYAELRNGTDEAVFLDKCFVGLYASQDNQTYSKIGDYSILNDGKVVSFYNFRVQARYLKIHSVTGQATPRTLCNSLQKMLAAKADFLFLRDGGHPFTGESEFTIENPSEKAKTDFIFSCGTAELPIETGKMQPDLRDLRFVYQDFVLPHVVVNGICYLRVYEIPAHGKINIRVLFGNLFAQSMENGAEALEIQYGTRMVAPMASGGFWVNTVSEMPNGDFLQMTGNGKSLYSRRSANCGHSWSDWKAIPASETVNPLSGGGFVVDKENNTVFLIGHGYTSGEERVLRQFVMESGDSGKTWSEPKYLGGLKRALSYSDGIKLYHSKNGVDYVFSYVGSNSKEEIGTSTAFYSKDGGKTWVPSESRVRYGDLAEQEKDLSHEGGCSEETIYEKSDGTLVMWSRYGTTEYLPHFAVSHSYDSGVTWGDTRLGNVFTTNTQPIITKYRGTPLLLWGGNNAFGPAAHFRLPLSIAYSDDEAESFHGIQNLIFRSQYAELSNQHEVTNPDIAIAPYYGTDHAFIVAKEYRVLIEDFGKAIFLTKGAYDSFETASPVEEGWLPFCGSLETSMLPNGNRGMCLESGVGASRCFPEARAGEIIFNFFTDDATGEFVLDFQSAYTVVPHGCAPISLAIGHSIQSVFHNQRTDTGLRLKKGENTLRIAFDGSLDSATLVLNGASAAIPFDRSIADYLCYLTIHNAKDCRWSLEKFILIDKNHFSPKG